MVEVQFGAMVEVTAKVGEGEGQNFLLCPLDSPYF